MTASTRFEQYTPTRPRRPFIPARFAVATAAALVVNAALFLIVSAAGASMVITQPSEMPLTVLIVIVATAVPLILAGIATWFLARRWPIVRTVAAWLGLGVALLSAPSPLLVSADTQTGITLGLMHVVAGAAWFIGVLKPAERR